MIINNHKNKDVKNTLLIWHYQVKLFKIILFVMELLCQTLLKAVLKGSLLFCIALHRLARKHINISSFLKVLTTTLDLL